MVQEELAYQADITTSYLSRVENGKQKLSFDIACRIAQALCISTDQLYEEKHDQAHKENSPLGIRMQQIEKQAVFHLKRKNTRTRRASLQGNNIITRGIGCCKLIIL